MSAQKIISDWNNKVYKPVYWLEGEEPFFIDQVMEYAEKHLLTESEASFNLTVFYGRDADWAGVLNACMRYPMFAERQVVLLKEAQFMKEIDKLQNYIDKPLASTIFVVGYKDKKIDGRSAFGKMLQKKTEYAYFKKLYEGKPLSDWVIEMVAGKGFQIVPAAMQLLIDHIGNDLSRLENEIEKVFLNKGTDKKINEDDIEKYVGVSKEFNAFELQAAIANKDLSKALRIIQYFEGNPKAGPIQMVLPAIYSYFSKLYSIFGMESVNENSVKPLFGNNFYAAKGAIDAARTFGQPGIEKILLILHEYNLRSVGVNNAGNTDGDLMKEMVIKMIR